MTSFADLFNPTFLIFLGIIILVTAILFLYFENKSREQNHKIASMLSLVSSLAEELNGVKLGLNHLSMIGAGHDIHFSNQSNFQPFKHLEENLNSLNEQNNLIIVSDDEDSDNEEESESDDEEDSDNEEDKLDSESESELEEIDEVEELIDVAENNYLSNDIKILKLNLSADSNIYKHDEEDIEEINNENEDVNTVEFLTFDNGENDNNDNNEHQQYDISSELKTINVNLEERKNIDYMENVDYKKLPLNKLRSVVAEKGLIGDASKLKKNEMLKLLGAE
jgi:hypothetical protein